MEMYSPLLHHYNKKPEGAADKIQIPPSPSGASAETSRFTNDKSRSTSASSFGHARGSSLGSGLARLNLGYMSAMRTNAGSPNATTPQDHLKSPPLDAKAQDILKKLEAENATVPRQDNTAFLLARIQKQNSILDADPKSVCIESNLLKTQSTTLNQLLSSVYEEKESPSVDKTGDDNEALYYAEAASPAKFDVGPEGVLTDSLQQSLKDSIPDWDFWLAMLQDYPSTAEKLPRLVSAKIQAGIPPKIRGLVWQSMSQATSTYLETMYDQLVQEKSPYERIIQRDLFRTFPHVKLFKEEGGIGQTRLENVLKAYSIYDPLVGYCQGLGFLVGPLLLNLGEKEAFCVFVRLMETYDMRGMFTLNMEGLQLRLYQFTSFLEQIMPDLYSHLTVKGVTPSMYASQWFLSLFAYAYPLSLVHRIFDVAFAEGAPETIFRVAIAMLAKNKDRLMALQEFEELLDCLMNGLYDAYDNTPRDVIKDAMSRSNQVTKEKIEELERRWIEEEERRRARNLELANVRFASVASKEAPSSPSVTAAVLPRAAAAMERINSAQAEQLTHQKETMLLHQQVEDLLSALVDLQKDHAQLTDILVKERMDKMDWVNKHEESNSRIKDLEEELEHLKAISADRAAIANGLVESGNTTEDLTAKIIDLQMESYEISQMNETISKRCASLATDLDEANSANMLLQSRMIELRESEARAKEELEDTVREKEELEKDWRERLAESRKLVLALQNHTPLPSTQRESMISATSSKDQRRTSILSFGSLRSDNANGDAQQSANMRELKLARRASSNLTGMNFGQRALSVSSEGTSPPEKSPVVDGVSDNASTISNGSTTLRRQSSATYSQHSESSASSSRRSSYADASTSVSSVNTTTAGNGSAVSKAERIEEDDDEHLEELNDEMETPKATFKRGRGYGNATSGPSSPSAAEVEAQRKVAELEMQLHETRSRLEDVEAECGVWRSRVDGLRTMMSGAVPESEDTTPKASPFVGLMSSPKHVRTNTTSSNASLTSTLSEQGRRFSDFFSKEGSSTATSPTSPGAGAVSAAAAAAAPTWGGLAKRVSSNWFGEKPASAALSKPTTPTM